MDRSWTRWSRESLILTLVAAGTVAVALQYVVSGLPLARAVGLLLVSSVLIALPTRLYRGLLLLLVAVPPGLTVLAWPLVGGQNVAAGVVIVAFVVLAARFRTIAIPRTVLIPAGLLVLWGFANYFFSRTFHQAASTSFYIHMFMFPSMFLVAAILVKVNERPERMAKHLMIAVVVSVLMTDAIALVQLIPSLSASINIASYPVHPGLLYHRTHFGYVSVLGLAVALPLILGSTRRNLGVVIGIFCSVSVILSLTRGAWLATGVVVLLIAAIYRRPLLAVAMFVAGLCLSFVAFVQQRVVADASVGLSQAFSNGSLGSHRLLLWRTLLQAGGRHLLTGNGVGYIWSLSPEQYFGAGQFVSRDSPFLFAHNDFLFLTLELGLPAAILFALTILAVGSRCVPLWRSRTLSHETRRLAVAIVAGTIIVFLTAALFDNAIFIDGLMERVAVVTGAWVGLLGVKGNGERRLPRTH